MHPGRESAARIPSPTSQKGFCCMLTAPLVLFETHSKQQQALWFNNYVFHRLHILFTANELKGPYKSYLRACISGSVHIHCPSFFFAGRVCEWVSVYMYRISRIFYNCSTHLSHSFSAEYFTYISRETSSVSFFSTCQRQQHILLLYYMVK